MNTSIIDDKPIQNPKDDILGYDKFAEDIANLLANQPQNTNFVMSINGEWGQGKSSSINMIKYYLDKKYNDKIIYADFSPWFFNGIQEALLRDFFHVLYNATSTLFDSIKKCGNKIYEELNTLLRCLNINFPSNIIEGASIGVDFSNLPENTEPTLSEIKESINLKLKNSSKKIVIFIDDLDRLNKTEILQIFSLIKSVADFPNIIYVLSCDKNVLCNILELSQGITGEKYLEKLVQLQLDLPIVETKFLRSILLDNINWGDNNEQSIIRNYYQHGIRQILNSPRKVKRFRQHFDILYSTIKKDVCTADFYAITFLKLFAPKAYNLIKENINWLAMPETMDRALYAMTDIQNSRFKEILEQIIQTLQEENPSVLINDWRYFLENMFPNVKLILNNQKPIMGYSIDDFKLKRIFCSDLCWFYFKFNYYSQFIRKSDFDAMLSFIEKPGDFKSYLSKNINLNKYDEHSLSFRLLNAMRYDYQQDIPLNKLEIIITDLLSSGFDFDNDNDISYESFQRQTFSSIANIIVATYFKNIENVPDRSEKLLSLIPNSDIGFLCYYIKFDEKFWGENQLVKIKESLAEKIQNKKLKLLSNKGLVYILGAYEYIYPDKFNFLLSEIANTDDKKLIIIKNVCPEYLGDILYTNSIYKHELIISLAKSIDIAKLQEAEKNVIEYYFKMLEN